MMRNKFTGKTGESQQEERTHRFDGCYSDPIVRAFSSLLDDCQTK